MNHPPVTALVASRNEARLLDRCLEAVEFCDEPVVLGPDCTGEHGARVLHNELVPIAERVRAAKPALLRALRRAGTWGDGLARAR